MINHDPELEELAYHKDAAALMASANWVVRQQAIDDGTAFSLFFHAGQLAGRSSEPCSYIAWHGDNRTLLLYFGSRYSAFDRVRKLPGRESDL